MCVSGKRTVCLRSIQDNIGCKKGPRRQGSALDDRTNDQSRIKANGKSPPRTLFACKNTILFASISAIGWSIVSPQLLTDWVNLFNIADNINQLSIYSPFNWIEVKWSFSIMMGIITAFPPFFSNVIQVLQTRAISKRVVSSQNNINCKLFVVAHFNIPNLGWGVPYMVKYANGLSQIDNISVRYDLFEIVNLALGLTLMATISFILTTSLILSRIIGEVDGMYTWLRPRIIIISFGLFIIMIPSVFEGLRITLAFVIIFALRPFCEILSPCRKYELNHPRYHCIERSRIAGTFVRSFKVVIATLILFGGLWVNLNPDLVNTTYNFDGSDENPNLVGLQEDEHWLVIRVAFPSMPHSLSGNGISVIGLWFSRGIYFSTIWRCLKSRSHDFR